jgi:hypothetical protein
MSERNLTSRASQIVAAARTPVHGAALWLDDKEEAEKPLSLAAFPLRGALALPRVLDHLGGEVHCRPGLDALQ